MWKKMVAACLAVAFGLTGAAAENGPSVPTPVAVPTVAVFNFDTRGRLEDSGAGANVAELLSVLLEGGEFQMVERAQIKTILDELKLSASGIVDKSSQVRVGHLLGAKILITGSVFRSGDKTYLVAKVIGTETGKVLGVSVNGIADPVDQVPGLAEKLTGLLNEKSAELLPKPTTAHSVFDELQDGVVGGGRKLYIHIPEQIAVTLPDPSAETALRELAQQLGFTVTTDAAAADFRVAGEAFAAPGAGFQSFASGTGRVELTLSDADGDILATTSCVNTVAAPSYAIAAKEALGQCALQAARTIFPVMGKK